MQNTGAAFSSFSVGAWFAGPGLLVMTALLGVAIAKNWLSTFAQWSMAVIMAGAFGTFH